MEFVAMAILFGLVFALGWVSGGVHVYNREIEILNDFRKRVEAIEAKYYAGNKEQVKHDEN